GARFRVTQAVMAGDDPHDVLAPGCAARIMTGAPVPAGADAVVPIEWVRTESEAMVVERVPREVGNVVPRGAHRRAGDVVARAGTPVLPATLGALASAGLAEVVVARRPTVAILGTGSELVPVHEAPGPGAIRNSNSAALAGQCRRAGASPTDLGIAPDEEGALRAAIARGLDHDVLLLSGGVSMGDKDLVPAALAAEGVRCVFHRWAVQPGGPLWFGVRDRTLVFGLPGNPAATFVGFELLVVPALGSRLGLPVQARRTMRATYEGPWGEAASRRRFRPVVLGTAADGMLLARAAPWHGSGDPFGLAGADGLAVLPEGLPPQTHVEVVPLGEALWLWGAA
ncbi:MAG: molybdopterin molybdotransferase MoeA, partial [Planctomycetota bacterium]|nr:molybdopterin molybdotransferase MoeA [Planctomycetota bacterium]